MTVINYKEKYERKSGVSVQKVTLVIAPVVLWFSKNTTKFRNSEEDGSWSSSVKVDSLIFDFYVFGMATRNKEANYLISFIELKNNRFYC